MTTISLERLGVRTPFPVRDPPLSGWWVEQEQGTGLPPLTRLIQRGPGQHGGAAREAVFDPRRVTLLLGMRGTSRSDLDAVRDALLRVCAPTPTPLRLIWTRPDASERWLTVFVRSGLAFGSLERLGLTQRAVLEFDAPDPLFRGPGAAIRAGVGVAPSAGLAVPLPVPVAVGSSTVAGQVVVAYPGDWDAPVVVTVRGPVRDLVIRNLTTGHHLDLTGVRVGTGDLLTIDTAYGAGTVIDGAGANRVALLSDASDLTTFRLRSVSDAPAGNVLRITGDDATSTTDVYVAYAPRYLGR
jgi:hypothetical protein